MAYTDGLILTNPREDLSGKKYNKLCVLRQGPDIISGNTRRAAYYCLCDCGYPEELLILADSIKGGHTKSCGKCAHKELYSENNIYDLSGKYGICTMADGNSFLFDLNDYELINKYTWHLSGRGYIGTTISIKKDAKRIHKTLLIHRLIMGVQNISWKECVVDHINGSTLDNRKNNLRVVTQSQNSMNQKKNKSNTSGVPGVSRMNNKWAANIKVNWKNIFLGIYDNFDEAVTARKDAEEKYFGEYSYDNSRINYGEKQIV